MPKRYRNVLPKQRAREGMESGEAPIHVDVVGLESHRVSESLKERVGGNVC